MTDLNSVANSSLSSLGSSGAGAAPPPFGTMMSSAAAAGGKKGNDDNNNSKEGQQQQLKLAYECLCTIYDDLQLLLHEEDKM